MSVENWLADRVDRASRIAHRQRCPKCGADTLAGPEHDRMAATAVVDAAPIHFADEEDLIASGVPTYDLIRAALYYREPWHRTEMKYPIHAEHRCPEQLTLGGN